MNLTTIPKTMSTREIAELTGKEHKNVQRDALATLQELAVDALSFERIYRDSMNREQTEYHLPKRESLILVSGYSVQMRARIIDRWQELEAQAAAPAQLNHSYHDAMGGMEIVARMLNIEGAAKLDLLVRTAAVVAPHLAPLLPGYGIDAPRTADTHALMAEGSSRATHSLTWHLKSRGQSAGSQRIRWCNFILQELGLLKETLRPTSNGGTTTYWSVTDAGLAYGKNVTNPKNQRETAPHWYDDTFDDLVDLVCATAKEST